MATTDYPDELICVRRRDVHEHRRHPVRRTVAFVVDMILHLGFAVVAGTAFTTALPGVPFWAVAAVPAGGYLLASFTHRVFFQNVFRATIGKLLVDLRLVRADTRRGASVGKLAGQWLLGCLAVVAQLLDGI